MAPVIINVGNNKRIKHRNAMNKCISDSKGLEIDSLAFISSSYVESIKVVWYSISELNKLIIIIITFN